MSQASKITEEKRRCSSNKESDTTSSKTVSRSGNTPKALGKTKPRTPLGAHNQKSTEDDESDRRLGGRVRRVVITTYAQCNVVCVFLVLYILNSIQNHGPNVFVFLVQVFDSDKDTIQTPVKKTQGTRAASTPGGNISHMSRISFCINVSAIPPSPIPTSLPIRIYPKGKDAQPGWISKKGIDEDGEEHQQEVICLPSPEQK
ncbi:hypothetical protein QZH41_018376 [Actinostola sp. cb2023]|nr:hypothetical protein QZH41_018376 [Actinostola sp. cb2023]